MLTSQPLAGLPSQFAKPALQPVTRQVPLEQAELALASAHTWLQEPQLSGSLPRATQAPLQLVSPAPQLSVQVPPEQTLPAGQTCPHEPQLFGSLLSATQAPLQRL